MSTVKFPKMRLELLEILRGLSDLEYQERVWVLDQSDNLKRHDNFDMAIHFLYDDTLLSRDPVAAIGIILRNMEEVEAITVLINAIDDLFDKYGMNMKDAEYIHTPDWQKILSSAASALALLQQA